MTSTTTLHDRAVSLNLPQSPQRFLKVWFFRGFFFTVVMARWRIYRRFSVDNISLIDLHKQTQCYIDRTSLIKVTDKKRFSWFLLQNIFWKPQRQDEKLLGKICVDLSVQNSERCIWATAHIERRRSAWFPTVWRFPRIHSSIQHYTSFIVSDTYVADFYGENPSYWKLLVNFSHIRTNLKSERMLWESSHSGLRNLIKKFDV